MYRVKVQYADLLPCLVPIPARCRAGEVVHFTVKVEMKSHQLLLLFPNCIEFVVRTFGAFKNEKKLVSEVGGEASVR